MSFAALMLSGRAWLVPALVILVILSGALVWSGHRSAAAGPVRIGCGILKFAGVLALALCLLEPVWTGSEPGPAQISLS